jgi:hypothetical protein
MLRLTVVAVAVAAAVVPLPAAVIERYYSSGFYPVWQSWMTPASNAVPVALLDVLIVVVAAAWLILAVNDVRRWRERGLGRAAGQVRMPRIHTHAEPRVVDRFEDADDRFGREGTAAGRLDRDGYAAPRQQ